MSRDGKRQVIVITGAAGGLGQALVEAFAAADWQIVAGWHQSPISGQPANVFPTPLDVTAADSVSAAFAETLARFGRLDALINNAGIARDALVAQMSDEDWQRVLEVNLKGAFLCAQAALRPMLKQRDGHILNISSFGGRVGREGQANYAASKAG